MKLSRVKKYIPTPIWLMYMYYNQTGRFLNFLSPKLLSEKTQILKVLQENHVDKRIGDKLLVKDLIKEKIGNKYIIPTQCHSDNIDNINFEELKYPLIIKSRHSSGDFKIIRNYESLNITELKKHFSPILNTNYYVRARGWQYKYALSGLIIENLLVDKNEKLPDDYKVICINGNPELIYVSIDREGINKRAIFDTKWRNIDACWTRHYKNCDEKKFKGDFKKPIFLKKILETAKVFAKITNLIRVDFLVSHDKIYINELTLHHGSGFDVFNPHMYEVFYGQLLIANR